MQASWVRFEDSQPLGLCPTGAPQSRRGQAEDVWGLLLYTLDLVGPPKGSWGPQGSLVQHRERFASSGGCGLFSGLVFFVFYLNPSYFFYLEF